MQSKLFKRVSCGLCGKTVEVYPTPTSERWYDPETKKEIKPFASQRITTLFAFDNTDGRPCTPYFANENVDLCPACEQKLLDAWPFEATADGKYEFREMR